MSTGCLHIQIENDEDHFRCSSCGEYVVIRTKVGTILTPVDIDRFVTETERS
jgi:predicted RNA-binding Zn-ribbon protein involved in translation (DUF1610 family)